MSIFCPNCGQKLDENANFCISCGNKIPETVKNIVETRNESTENIVEEKPTPTNEIIMDSNQGEEVELFFSEKEKIRKTGEKRYGKGTFRITNKYLYLDYRRKRQNENHKIPIKNIVKALPFLDHFMHMPIATPSTANMPQDWHVLDIKLTDGSGFQIYIGTPTWGGGIGLIPKFDKVMELLNPPGSIPEDPWQLDKIYMVNK